MNKIFNTTFETSLRVLLLLSQVQEDEMTLDRIAQYDFITIYSKYFHLSEIALHGENEFGLSEFAARREATKSALKSLVLKGLVDVRTSQAGFRYVVSANGFRMANQMQSEYAITYKCMVSKTMAQFDCMNENEIANIIGTTARTFLER